MDSEGLVFTPKKWTAVKICAGMGTVFLTAYGVVPLFFSEFPNDVGILLIGAAIFYGMATIATFFDIDKARLLRDRIEVHRPFWSTPVVVYPEDIQEIFIDVNEDSDYGDTLCITITLNKERTTPRFTSFCLRHNPDNKKMRAVLEFIRTHYGEKIKRDRGPSSAPQ